MAQMVRHITESMIDILLGFIDSQMQIDLVVLVELKNHPRNI